MQLSLFAELLEKIQHVCPQQQPFTHIHGQLLLTPHSDLESSHNLQFRIQTVSLKPIPPLWERCVQPTIPSDPVVPPPPESTLQPGGIPQPAQGHSYTPLLAHAPVPTSEPGDGSAWQLLAPSASGLRPPLFLVKSGGRTGEKEGAAFL